MFLYPILLLNFSGIAVEFLKKIISVTRDFWTFNITGLKSSSFTFYLKSVRVHFEKIIVCKLLLISSKWFCILTCVYNKICSSQLNGAYLLPFGCWIEQRTIDFMLAWKARTHIFVPLSCFSPSWLFLCQTTRSSSIFFVLLVIKSCNKIIVIYKHFSND